MFPISMQYIRKPQIVKLSPVIKKWNENFKNKYGLSAGSIKWGIVAKAKWYWNTDILYLGTPGEAAKKILSDSNFNFIILSNKKVWLNGFANNVNFKSKNKVVYHE